MKNLAPCATALVLVLGTLAGCSVGQQPSGAQNAADANASAAANSAAASNLDPTPPTIDADALKAAASDDAVKAFYQKTGWHGLWSEAATSALDHAIGSRLRNGLDHVDFGRVEASMSPAERDVVRTKAALTYAAALANGLADPTELHEVYTIPGPQGDVPGGLAQALAGNRVGEFFSALVPQDDDYKRLSHAYVEATRSAPDSGAPAIPDKETIHPGDRDPRLPEIARELASNGYLPQNAVPTGNGNGGTSPDTGNQSDAADQGPVYAPALVDAVKRLQVDYGIKTDGVIGSDTLAVINIGPADKARNLAVAMERRRWLSRTPPATRIDVNAADATLRYYRDGKLIDQRRVIVGQPGRETPPLRAPLYRLVANPTWTVPQSIPVSSATVRQKNMHRVNGYWVQPAGPNNALGLVKFDMQDDQQIYLHDTSDRSLFGRAQRDLSHGCVRVQDALGFAKMIAQQEGIGTQWQQARQSGEQTFVKLPQPIPVRLLYWNTFIDNQGQVAFRTDPYGWNDAVAEKLGFDASSSKKAMAQDIDIGP